MEKAAVGLAAGLEKSPAPIPPVLGEPASGPAGFDAGRIAAQVTC